MSKKARFIFVIAPIMVIVIAFCFAGAIRIIYTSPYNKAEALFDKGSYEEAKEKYQEVVPFKDSVEKIKECDYQIAVRLYEARSYEEAIKVFESIRDYSDSEDKINDANNRIKDEIEYATYQTAKDDYKEGNYFDALNAFESLGKYGDAEEWVEKSKDSIRMELSSTIYAGSHISYAITTEGKIVSTDREDDSLLPEQKQYENWGNLISISAKDYCVIALDANGTPYLACGNIDFKKPDISTWTDELLQVDSGNQFVAALTVDQKVLADGRNRYNQCTDVKGWSDIVQIACGTEDIVGLDANGIIHISGQHSNLAEEIAVDPNWSNIVQIAVGSGYDVEDGGFHIVGLKANGDVVAIGDNNYGQLDGMDTWHNIKKVTAGNWTTVGITVDDTVKVVGYNTSNEYDNAGNVEEWKDIIDVSAGRGNTIGVDSEGNVFATGFNLSPKTYQTIEWSKQIKLKEIF